MTYRFHWLWYVMIAATAAFLALYIWSAAFPGQPGKNTYNYFSKQEIGLARDHARTERIVSAANFAASLVFLLWFVMGRAGKSLSAWCERFTGNYALSLILFFLILWAAQRLIDLPFSLYDGYFLQKSWGFSTQSFASWRADYIKNAAMDIVMTGIGMLLLFFAMNSRPNTWHVAAWAFISVWLVLQSLIWPVLVEPMFNSFQPAKDPRLVTMVKELAGRAEIPVDQVLIMDASRRTTRANAYFTGVGKVKRIVLYDNLVNDYPEDEVEAVVAHEMAHWKQGHIIKGLAEGSIGVLVLLLILRMLIKADIPFNGHYPPYVWAYVTLFFLLASYISNPIYNYASRSMEAEADRISASLTGDAGSVIKLQTDLTVKNVSDMSPPPFIEWFSYSHPSGMHRIEAAERLMPPDV